MKMAELCAGPDLCSLTFDSVCYPLTALMIKDCQ